MHVLPFNAALLTHAVHVVVEHALHNLSHGNKNIFRLRIPILSLVDATNFNVNVLLVWSDLSPLLV